MKTITKYAFFILTVALAFGSFNPFDMRGIGSITEQVEEQRGYTPLLFAACILLSLIDKNNDLVFAHISIDYIKLTTIYFNIMKNSLSTMKITTICI